jgi:hypothetical protein
MAPDNPDFSRDLGEGWPDGPEPEDTGPWSDEAFWAMARRVRQVAEQELAEIEYETERAELKREDLTARSVRAMMEGERWQVVVGPKVIEGIVVHAGMNFLGMQDRAGNLHDLVHHAIGIIRVVEHDPTMGRAPITFRPATFRARLLSLEQMRPVELAGASGSWTVMGTIESVNSDHLILSDHNQQMSLVPIDAIGSVSRSTPRHRRG